MKSIKDYTSRLQRSSISPDEGEPSETEGDTPESEAMPQSLIEDARFFSDLCTRLWRVENRLTQMIGSRPDDTELERLGRRFGEIIDTLERYDCEIIDPTGQKFDAGLSLRVVQYEPRAELTEEIIIETVKPTLRIKGVVIPGEVVVGVPASPQGDTSSASADITTDVADI